MTGPLEQAKAWQAETCSNSQSNAIYQEFCARKYHEMVRILPGLVAEYESALAGAKGADLAISELRARLRHAEAKCDQLKEFSDDLMFNCNQLRNRTQIAEGKCKRLQAELKITTDRAAHNAEQDAAREQILREELARWQKIAIEERAGKLILIKDCTQNEDAADFHHRCECGYSLEKCPIADWWREQAARELGIAPDEQVGTGVFLVEANQAFTDDDAARILKIIEENLMDCDCPKCKADVAVMMKFHDAVLAQSRPVWQITEERITTLRRAHDEYKILPKDFAVLKGMLEECKK